jgi:hypothetical protein
MFPHNKSVHHSILCIAEQIQLMTKTTPGDESDIQVDDIQVESLELIRQNTFND